MDKADVRKVVKEIYLEWLKDGGNLPERTYGTIVSTAEGVKYDDAWDVVADYWKSLGFKRPAVTTMQSDLNEEIEDKWYEMAREAEEDLLDEIKRTVERWEDG
jgi:hypothetical protein